MFYERFFLAVCRKDLLLAIARSSQLFVLTVLFFVFAVTIDQVALPLQLGTDKRKRNTVIGLYEGLRVHGIVREYL